MQPVVMLLKKQKCVQPCVNQQYDGNIMGNEIFAHSRLSNAQNNMSTSQLLNSSGNSLGTNTH